MLFFRLPLRNCRTVLPPAWQKPSRALPIPVLFCVVFSVAFVAFMLSCVVSIAAARPSVRFWSALCAVLATTAVQKLSTLQLVVALFYRKHSMCANVVELLLSNWTDSVLVTVAAWTGQREVIPAFIVGAVTINHLFLLGVCFINGSHHTSKTRYPSMMASIHVRLLPIVIAILVCASSAEAWSGVSDEHKLRLYCVTAPVLLLLFTGHVIHVCRLNSWIVQAADPLLRLTDCYNRGYSASSESQKIDAAGAHRLRRERRKWLDDCLAISGTRRSNSDQCQPWDSVLVVVLLLLSCGASFGSCVQLLGSLEPDETTSLQSPLHVGHVFLPISTCAAGLVALQLHGKQRSSACCFDSILCGAVISTLQLICFALPAFVITRWATASLASIEFLYGYQVGLLAIAILVPAYAMQNGGDDWLTGTALILLYVVYVVYVW